MRGRDQLRRSIVALGVATLLLAAASARLGAQQNTGTTIHIRDNDLGGVVTGKNGPEPGVWVIAETKDLGTRFAKSRLPTSAAATSSRTCQRAIIGYGYGAMALSTRLRSQASRARSSI